MKIYKCAITGIERDTLRGFLNHIRTLKLTSKEYYDKFVKTPEEGICKCGNQTKYGGWSYAKWCSNDCIEFKKYLKECISNKFKGDDRQEKLDKWKERRGIVDVNLTKRRETITNKVESMGITLEEYYSNHARKGFESRSEESIRDSVIKRHETIMNSDGNFGGKSGYKSYNLFDSVIKTQGFEPLILDYLQTILSKDELIADGKNIGYINYISTDNKQHMYFPDMMIPNYIVEVKSKYTYNQHRENVYAKIGGVFNQSKNMLLVIPTAQEVRKNKLDGSKKLLDWAISSQASNNQPHVLIYDEGSTTILYGVESSDSKCRGSERCLTERDIVWSSVKAEAIYE